MALQALLKEERTFFTVAVLLAYLACKVTCETGDCRQQEFRDQSGNCVPCKQCGPGLELSKECGFGYGEDAQCVTCRPHRFKEDRGFQKCKPCLDCAVANRFLKANCSVTRDAVCGDCLPGFYRKTKLVGFQDMECVPCGDPPPPYEPHCTSKVNLVKIPSTASSPRDTALAAVICSALATVLLALLILCVIYCKRQFMEKKPSWSLRAQDIPYNGSELSCFDRPQLSDSGPRACCRCHRGAAPTCGPVHLVPALCCDDACSTDLGTLGCGVRSKATLQDRHAGPAGQTPPAFFGSLPRPGCGEFSDAWPLMRNPVCGDDASFCDSYAELTGGDTPSLTPERESASSLGSRSRDSAAGGPAPFPAPSETVTETTAFSRRSSAATGPARTQGTPPPGCQPDRRGDDVLNPPAQRSLQES